jgi:hypothetical protein
VRATLLIVAPLGAVEVEASVSVESVFICSLKHTWKT